MNLPKINNIYPAVINNNRIKLNEDARANEILLVNANPPSSINMSEINDPFGFAFKNSGTATVVNEGKNTSVIPENKAAFV